MVVLVSLLLGPKWLMHGQSIPCGQGGTQTLEFAE